MADVIVIDVDAPEMNFPDQPKKLLKRKRVSSLVACTSPLTPSEIDAKICSFNSEIDSLHIYYQEVLKSKPEIRCIDGSGSVNALVATLIEESQLPLSKLVNEVYEKVKIRDSGVTMASVKSSLLFVGQRVAYGGLSPDADILEDENVKCLWCWETRDLKLMPKHVRGVLKIRRICRTRILDRVTSVSAMITALQKSVGNLNCSNDLMKASKKLHKVLCEADIRKLVDSMMQKNDTDLAEKEVKQKERLLLKQLEKNKQEDEKEKIKIDYEMQREKWHIDKEQKRLQEEAAKDEKHSEKEAADIRRQMRKQQEEAEKTLRRREKEEAVKKKQLSMQKQASIMERFLSRGKKNSHYHNDRSSSEVIVSDLTSKSNGTMPEAVTHSMDSAILLSNDISINDIRKLHLISWRCLGHSIRFKNKQHWGIRQISKTEHVKEPKQGSSKGLTHDNEFSAKRHVNGWGETSEDAGSSLTGLLKCNQSRQLLQFDKSYRPAFYGVWSKKSNIVGPRHPFKRDPDLNYDIDSDEEWEEEDPGESISDCDKDDEEESLEEGYSKVEEDESEDDFFVPDGYLSENEGVQVDRMEFDNLADQGKPRENAKQETESEEFLVLLRQQSYLSNLTEHALRKNQPLIVLNLAHEKAPLLVAEDLSGTQKLEQTCLQALSICTFFGGRIEISVDYDDGQDVVQEPCPSNTPMAVVPAIVDSDLPEIVSAITSCSQGINKVVECLQHKFPAAPKSQLRNKIREISDFVDNRWQVKQDILNKLGISVSPDKGHRRITTFFSKRCLPPSGGAMNLTETSPQPSRKLGADISEQQDRTQDQL